MFMASFCCFYIMLMLGFTYYQKSMQNTCTQNNCMHLQLMIITPSSPSSCHGKFGVYMKTPMKLTSPGQQHTTRFDLSLPADTRVNKPSKFEPLPTFKIDNKSQEFLLWMTPSEIPMPRSDGFHVLATASIDSRTVCSRFIYPGQKGAYEDTLYRDPRSQHE